MLIYKTLHSFWLISDVQWTPCPDSYWTFRKYYPPTRDFSGGDAEYKQPLRCDNWQLLRLCSVRQSRTKVTRLVTEEQDSRWALRLSPGLTVFWQPGTAACTLVIPCSESNVEQRGSVHSGTLLLGILEMRISEAHHPHSDTEHMPCYHPTEQHIMILPTINS